MTISAANKEFMDSLIDYYISESGSYKQIAEQYVPEIESTSDAAFGIIVGCIYSSFLEMCKNQDIQIGLEEMTGFNEMLKSRAASIKKSIVDPSSVASLAGGVTGTIKNTSKLDQGTEDKKAAKATQDNGEGISEMKREENRVKGEKDGQTTVDDGTVSPSPSLPPSSLSSSPPPQSQDSPVHKTDTVD